MFTLMHGCLLTFIYLHVYQIGRKLWWKYRLESLALLQYQRVRKLHHEMNVELPLHDRHDIPSSFIALNRPAQIYQTRMSNRYNYRRRVKI
jgi:hypothetical protein